MIDASEIGKRLKMLRGEKSIQTVSKDTGIGASAISMYETGRRIPRDEAKMILADYYDVSIERLFFAPVFTKR